MNKLLIHTYEQEAEEILTLEKKIRRFKAIGMIALLVLTIFLIRGCNSPAMASVVINEPNIAGYSLNQWCNAIYKAEGGAKTAHPYGILAHYMHTTPLEACKNTVRHKYLDWKRQGQHGTFLAYLGAKYCPVGCKNDNGTNKNWVKNVTYYLQKGT